MTEDSHIATVVRRRKTLVIVQWNACATYLAVRQCSEVMITVQGCVETPQLDCISYFERGQQECDI